ncbi:MAG TPA: N-acyl homoserine lactonase family protein [Terriglobales bacterium]|nr:N-acyl homoserine lactonase family protein [Terriglobales bacterium]
MRLYLMQLADFPGMGGAPVPGYLVQTDDGQNVLIDTGVSRQLIGAYGRSPGVGIRMEADDYVVSQLDRIGVSPEDVRYLVCTHYDGDHAGNHDAFPSAELVVQRVHHEAAMAGMDRFQSLRAQWDRPGGRYRFVDGDAELLPGIELIETSGHVPGHQAVLVRLAETGPVLLAIDAIPAGNQLDPDTREITPFDQEEAGVRASTRKLVELAASEQVTLMVFGHDAEQWQGLRKLPDFYS